MSGSRFITRVVLEDYKSIASCDVHLGSLTFLVGPNGAGKSNFVDALRFVTDSLNTSLDFAMRNRGAFAITRRSSLDSTCPGFGIRLEWTLVDGVAGHLSFRIGTSRDGNYHVEREELYLRGHDHAAHYSVVLGQVESTSARVAPAAAGDRLFLVNASGLPEFRPAFEALSNMMFYGFDVGCSPSFGAPFDKRLTRNGGNLAHVIGVLAEHEPIIKARIEEYLKVIYPGLSGLKVERLGDQEFLFFLINHPDSEQALPFFAMEVSEGTRHALGILVALLQVGSSRFGKVPLLGFEEPETLLHPAAAGVLLGCLRGASEETQIIVTSHSPDLLDDKDIDSDAILAVVAEDGVTRIGPLDDAGRSALRGHLYTAGELLRLNQLALDPQQIRSVTEGRPRLFSEVGA